MNTLFHQMTWSDFIQATLLLLTIYYIFIALKYYPQELRGVFNRLTGKKEATGELPAVLQYRPEAPQTSGEDVPRQTGQDIVGEAYELGRQLKVCINGATGKPFAPAPLIQQLKKILNDFPDIAAAPDRELINELIVTECEKTGTALLSESEVDQWWSA